MLWPTSEHLYQALKFMWKTPAEKEWCELIRTANTPFISKYLGHQMTSMRYSWCRKYRDLVKEYSPLIRHAGNVENVDFRRRIMYKALKAKFALPELRDQLLATGEARLGEAGKDAWAIEGGTLLGELLMQRRAKARKYAILET